MVDDNQLALDVGILICLALDPNTGQSMAVMIPNGDGYEDQPDHKSSLYHESQLLWLKPSERHYAKVHYNSS